MDILQKAFNGSFSANFVATVQIVPLIEHYVKDKTIVERARNVLDIEQAIRNLAAHEIVSVTREWIKDRTGFTVEEIFRLVKYLVEKAGIQKNEEKWKSYDRMNALILERMQL